MYFNTIKKLLVTILVLCVYVVSRLIILPGMSTISSTEYEYTNWVFFIETLNGNVLNKYNIFGVGLTPLITFLLFSQTYSILYKMFFLTEFKITYRHYIVYIPIISIIESYIYSKQLIFLETNTSIVSLYNSFLYFYLALFLLVVGSLLVCLFIFFINKYGLGKGFSFILLINFFYAFFSNTIQSSFEIYYNIILLIQCVVCYFLFNKLNKSSILVPVVSYFSILGGSRAKNNKNEYSVFFYNFLSIIPFIIVDITFSRDHEGTLYQFVVVTLLQSILIFFVIILFSKLFKRLFKYRERRTNILNSFFNEYDSSYFFASRTVYKSVLFDFLYLLGLVFISRIDLCFYFCLQFFNSSILSMGSIHTWYPIDTIHNSNIFLFILLIRMFLFVLDRTDLYLLRL